MTPRQRQRAIRGSLYVLLIAAVAAALLFADWASIQRNFFRWDIAVEMFPEVLTRLRSTPSSTPLVARAGAGAGAGSSP